MVASNEYKTYNKGYTWMYVSVWLFVLVLILNIWLYFYNSYLSSKVESFNEDLIKLENNIKEVNNDDKVKLYTLIKTNAVFLDKYSYLSRIPEFINNLKKLWSIYRVSFKNFSYADSTLNTSVVAVDDWISFWYQKAQKLISSFRNNKQTKNNQIFSLDFVDYFESQNEMKFNVSFKIK